MLKIPGSLLKIIKYLHLTYYLINLGHKPMPETRINLYFKASCFYYKSVCLALLFMTGCFIPTQAQDNTDKPAGKKIHTVLIKVRAPDKSKIPGATVILYDKSDMHVMEKKTVDANCNATFTFATFHDYIIEVKKQGYLTKRIWINSQPLGKENKTMLEYDNDIIMYMYNTDTEDAAIDMLDKPSMKLAYLPKGPVQPGENPFDYDQSYENAMKREAKKIDPQTRENDFNALIAGKPLPGKTVEINLTYKDAMALGDKAMAAKDFLKARDDYNKALDAKPGDKKASDQLVVVDRELGINAYQDLVKKADKLFIDKEFSEAKRDYEECLSMKPKEKWPKEQLEKIIRKYTDAINKADDLFSAKNNLKDAKEAYKEALAISPNEQYPKDQIKEINKKLKDSGGDSGGDDYAANIVNADKSFKDKNYAYANYYYTKANKQKPTEKYPKDQLAKVKALLNSAAYKKTLDLQYNDDMKKGKEAFDNKDYTSAKADYKDAAILKPEQKMPPLQLAKIDQLMKAAQHELDEKYATAIALGDNEFKQKHLDKAKMAYSDALSLKAEESYPKDKLAEIDLLLQKKASVSGVSGPYQDAIAKADKAFDKKDYKNARMSYVEAGVLKPDEQYPKDRIAEIDRLLKSMTASIESFSPGKHKEILDAQVIQEMQEKHDELVEKSKQLQLLKKAYIKRMANLSTKYDTENPLTRLLDIVDSKPAVKAKN